jgi:PmbA protein
MTLLGPDRILSDIGAALRDAPGPAIATVKAYDMDVCRFAESRVHQPQAFTNHLVTVRVFRGRQLGEATINDISKSGVQRALRRAWESAAALPEAPKGYLLPGDAGSTDSTGDAEASRGAWDDATAAAGPADKAPFLAASFGRAGKEGMRLAGAWSTGAVERAVLDTAGSKRYFRSTRAGLKIWALKADGSGDASSFAAQSTGSVAGIDAERIATTALERCRLAVGPQPIDPGPIDVVLSAHAVAELLGWMAQTGFDSRSHLQGTGFLAGRQGERVTSSGISIAEDPFATDPGAAVLPFDDDGVSCRRVSLIDRGVAGSPVHSRWSAAEAGCSSTGGSKIGGLSPDPGGRPRRLRVAPGDSSEGALIAGVERGLFLTRFHYVNGMLDPRRALMTGLTRDGAFRIEDGRITGAVHNLRFTEPILEAFERVDGVASDLEAIPGWWLDDEVHLCPALRVRGFTFTGRQDLAAVDD